MEDEDFSDDGILIYLEMVELVGGGSVVGDLWQRKLDAWQG